jgi:hypothetical protein
MQVFSGFLVGIYFAGAVAIAAIETQGAWLGCRCPSRSFRWLKSWITRST